MVVDHAGAAAELAGVSIERHDAELGADLSIARAAVHHPFSQSLTSEQAAFALEKNGTGILRRSSFAGTEAPGRTTG